MLHVFYSLVTFPKYLENLKKIQRKEDILKKKPTFFFIPFC